MKKALCTLVLGPLAVVLAATTCASAAGHYALAYWREIGSAENSLNHSMYVHVFDEAGKPKAGVQLYTTWNVLLGTTDANGYAEVAMAVQNSYDMKCVDPDGSTSDVAYTMTTRRQPDWGHYSYDLAFLFKANPSNPVQFDTTLIGTLNTATDYDNDIPSTRSLAYDYAKPADRYSDQAVLGTVSDYAGQSFVANGDRVVACKIQATTGFGNRMRWSAQILAGGPNGSPVGPVKTTREMVSDEFHPILVTWGTSDVPVIKGKTYFLKVWNADGGGMSVYHAGDNYPAGTYYENATPVPSRDIKGLVVCANAGPPSPPSSDLINPDFEGGFGGNGVAKGWTSFVSLGTPTFLDEVSAVRGGAHAQRWWTSYTTHDAGVYQRVAATSGASYTFSAWTIRYDVWNNGNENLDTWVGISPTGGTDATAAEVIWSPAVYSYGTWTNQSVSATAQGDAITVFIRGRANFAGKTMISIADDARLTSNAPTSGAIAGSVHDTSNNPISGATVSTTKGGYSTTSGADGSYALAKVAAGTYDVIASKTGYTSQTNTNVLVTGGATVTTSFNLSPQDGAIRGFVNDNAGNPIRGATVSRSPGGYLVTTAADGSYSLTAVAPGTYSVTASKAGYVSQTNSNVVVAAGQTATSSFTLTPTPTPVASLANGDFEGGFYDDPDADHRSGKSWHRFSMTGASKAGGNYGEYRSSHWSQSIYESSWTAGIYQQVADAVSGHRYTATAWVKGSDSGVKFWVGLDATGGTDPGSGNVEWSAESLPGPTWAQISKSAVAAGTTLTVFIKAQNTVAANRQAFIEDASLTDDGAAATGAIAGNVKDNSGNNLSGVTLSTSPGGYSTTTDAIGNYTLGNLSPGSYDVSASKAGYASQTQSGKTVSAGQTTTVNFTLTPAGNPCVATVPQERWKGEYFNNRELTGSPVMVRDDGPGPLSFDWGTGSPGASCGVPTDGFSARWTRTVSFEAGTYRFTVRSDDGFRFYVDEQLRLDKWIDQAPTTYTVDVALSAGPHNLRHDYYENGGGAVAALSWSKVSDPGSAPSKLTIHTAFTGPLSMPFIRDARPRLVKILDNFGPAAEIKSISPSTVIIGRIFQTDQSMDGDPAQRAQQWWDRNRNIVLAYPAVDYWEGYNEPGVETVEKLAWYARFEEARVNILAQNARKACIGSFSMGTPDITKPAMWPTFYPAIDAARAHGGILGLHEYGTPMQQYFEPASGEGWLCGRYRKVYRQHLIPDGRVLPLAITETGVDGVAPVGWKNHYSGSEYLEQLKWYDGLLRQDDYVLGATIFALEIYGWDSFDIAPIVGPLTEYVRRGQ